MKKAFWSLDLFRLVSPQLDSSFTTFTNTFLRGYKKIGMKGLKEFFVVIKK